MRSKRQKTVLITLREEERGETAHKFNDFFEENGEKLASFEKVA